MAFNSTVKKGWCPNLNVLLASPTSPIPPEGLDGAVVIVTRNVNETLGCVKLVYSKDEERDSTYVRVINDLAPRNGLYRGNSSRRSRARTVVRLK